MTTDDGASRLLVSAQVRYLDVVKALMEVGARELVMLTADDRVS